MARPVSNPPNPWQSQEVHWLGPPPEAALEVHAEEARTVLSRNESSDVPFRWSLNPYRGCQHACAYCYARPTHQYLDWGAGTDFDRRIVVKTNAATCLERELRRPNWSGETICFSGNTDCYQAVEASWHITRRCLEVALRYENPVVVITKSALVRRDAELLARFAADGGPGCRVFVSIPFADEVPCRAIEPGAPTPEKRFETLAALADAGVPVGVAVAPIIPGLNDEQVPEILARAAAAGADQAFPILLRLPREVEPVFRERLEQALPARVKRVFSALRDARGGNLKESRFGQRMGGQGPRWEIVLELFRLGCRKHGLQPGGTPPARPRPRQTTLFETP